jgi:hypothetical protein
MVFHRIIMVVGLMAGSLLAQSNAPTTAKIQSVTGDVEIRLGMDETWQAAKADITLREIDTILTGKDGRVELKLSTGASFILGARSMLDISDLRNISEQDLFLWMMSSKVKSLDVKTEKQPVRIGNVSVVHGESKAPGKPGIVSTPVERIEYEKNGAMALYNYKLFPNCIIKMHRLLSTNVPPTDCGEIHYVLGKSFAAIQKNGQAMDEFQTAITCQQQQNGVQPTWLEDARLSMSRLQAETH